MRTKDTNLLKQLIEELPRNPMMVIPEALVKKYYPYEDDIKRLIDDKILVEESLHEEGKLRKFYSIGTGALNWIHLWNVEQLNRQVNALTIIALAVTVGSLLFEIGKYIISTL